jgi:hypothetical protein
MANDKGNNKTQDTSKQQQKKGGFTGDSSEHVRKHVPGDKIQSRVDTTNSTGPRTPAGQVKEKK